ncbi:MAG: hypothetical protein AAGF74_03510 [Pseudomonadota bacterium]
MKLETRLEVPQRGSRDYLQGGDILRSIFEEFSKHRDTADIADCRLRFSSLSHTLPTLLTWPEGEPAPAGALSARLSIGLRDGERIIGGLRDTGAPLLSRIEGFERDVNAVTAVDGQTALSAPVEGADLIEQIVFTIKFLHNTVLPLKAGRWAVVEFNLLRYLPREGWGSVAADIESISGNNRITETRVRVGKETIGSVRFTALV